MRNRSTPAAKPQQPPPAPTQPPLVMPDPALAEARRAIADMERQRTLEAAQAQERIAMLEAEKRAAENERRDRMARDAVRAAARTAGAVDEEDAAAIIFAQAKFKVGNDGKVSIDGKPDVALDAFVNETLATKPHLLKAKTQPGSGASPFPTAPVSGTQTYDLRTAEGMTAYARARTHDKKPATPTP